MRPIGKPELKPEIIGQLVDDLAFSLWVVQGLKQSPETPLYQLHLKRVNALMDVLGLNNERENTDFNNTG